ncbi:hypothetical protein, partial [Zoogloea sp.]|uniref:hypothetical protein n=1 Tax=Zoogloea sp. TaxID=49181 RepID=UPI002B8972BB
MSRHTILPGHPLTALFLLHVGSMDARLIGLSVERHWKHTVRLTANLDDAGVVLIDCDRPGVEAAFEKLVPHPRTGVVCYAFHPKDHAARFPNRVILGKPLNLEALPAILAKAAADSARIIAAPPLRRLTPTPPPLPAEAAPAEIPPSLGHGLQTEDERDLCGAMDDLPPKPSYPLPDKLFFNPDEYLIGHLHRAIEHARSSGRPYLIAGLPRLIAIRPLPEPACITDFRNNQLRPLSMAQLPHSTARLIGTSTLGYVNGSETVSAAEDFLWNVAAWAARGRLPEGTDPYKPVRLRAWPNFTQVFMSPHALRISALWVRTWASPVEIAFRLGIPQRYVFS